VKNAELHHIQENKAIYNITVTDAGFYHGSKLLVTRHLQSAIHSSYVISKTSN
jgi:hypothetical protein